MKKLLATIVLLLGLASFANAGVTISSVTGGILPTPVLLLNPNESLTYTLRGTFTGTARLEKSFDGTNYQTVLSSVNNSAATLTGVQYSGKNSVFYRWRGSTITAGSFIFELSDNDDLVGQFNNNKNIPILTYNDDSVRVAGNLTSTGLLVSTATTSGTSLGNTMQAYLSGTLAAAEGSLLIATTPVAGYGFTVAVASLSLDTTAWVGIAKSAAAVGSVLSVYYDGFVLALTTGPVNAGDTLVSTGTAYGYLGADTTPTTGADVGVAIGAGTTTGGLTKIKLRQ